MNAIVRHLQRDLEVSFGTRIGSISRVGERWALRSEDGRDLGAFDLVLAAIPFPQAEDLLSAHQPAFGSRFEDHTVLPSICTMVAFERSLGIDWNAAFVEDDVLSWIARDGSKPGRSGAGEQMVLHSTGAWAEEVLEQGPDEWIPAMLEAFSRTLGQELPDALHTAAHRWRYALPTGDGGSDASFDESTGLGLAGDACTGGRVEGAFLSGQDLAGRVLRFLTLRTPTRAT